MEQLLSRFFAWGIQYKTLSILSVTNERYMRVAQHLLLKVAYITHKFKKKTNYRRDFRLPIAVPRFAPAY